MRILLLDTENAPNYGSFWGIHEQHIRYGDIEQEWFFISAQWKFLGEKTVQTVSVLDDVKTFIRDHTNDKVVVKKVHQLLQECDVVVGHNIIGHDLKKLWAKFIEYRLEPIDMPYIVDTLVWVRKYGFTSRKLADLCTKLSLTPKLEHDRGIFQKAGRGDVISIRKTVRYGKGDVPTLEELYLLIRPYAKHPNENAFKNYPCCPKCGSVKFQSRGKRDGHGVNRFQCAVPACRAWFTENKIKQRPLFK